MTLHNSDASEYSSNMTFTEELRMIVRDCGISRYEIAKRTGLSQGGLAAFMAGGDVTTRTLDALAPVLGIRLVADDRTVTQKRPKRPTTRKGDR